jgi:pimeloyl-ACP methyl ester carboxylesterase
MIALDRPGVGRSDFQPGRSYLDWAGDVGAVADHLGIERFAVIGFSSGGPYAAVVAHEMPERLTIVAIAAGEGPYRHPDYPWSALGAHSFGVSPINRLFMFSAKYAPFIMRGFFRVMRIMIFADPVGVMQDSGGDIFSGRDLEMFTRQEYALGQVEALRQGARGATHDFTLERRDWPFALEDIRAPEVLLFHGQDDGGVDPAVGAFVCGLIPACDEAVVFPGEGHSVLYHRYDEIAGAMLTAWKY